MNAKVAASCCAGEECYRRGVKDSVVECLAESIGV